MRIGHGYDVHRRCEDRPLIIGGVNIPYEKGPLGHSDADVLLHAVGDALLGAAALGDIGKQFPDNDDNFKNGINILDEYCKENAVMAMAAVQLGIPKRLVYLKNTNLDIINNAS